MNRLSVALPLSRHHGKWIVYLLILLTPGSFVVIALLGLIKLLVRVAAHTRSRAVQPAMSRYQMQTNQ